MNCSNHPYARMKTRQQAKVSNHSFMSLSCSENCAIWNAADWSHNALLHMWDATMRIRDSVNFESWNKLVIDPTYTTRHQLPLWQKRIIFCQIIMFSSCGVCHGWKGAVTLQVNKVFYREWNGNSPSEQTTTKSYPRLVFQKKGSVSQKSSIMLCLRCSVLILLAWETSLLRKQASYLALPVCFPCTVQQCTTFMQCFSMYSTKYVFLLFFGNREWANFQLIVSFS